MTDKLERPLDATPIKREYAVTSVEGKLGASIQFSAERGGIITSLKLNGVDVLFMNESTFSDPTKSVRGGVPVLFPNAGPLEVGNAAFPDLKQHGFVRSSDAWQTTTSEDGFRVEFASNEATREQFAYDFTTAVNGRFEDDGSITIIQEATNLETDKVMPISMGLHPYFKVPNDEKKNIKFNFPGGEEIESRVDEWSNDKMVSIDNPKLADPAAVLRIDIPGLGTLVLDVSPEYQKIWVWSLPGQDFICIEPVMRDNNGLIDDPQMVIPGETFSASMNISLVR